MVFLPDASILKSGYFDLRFPIRIGICYSGDQAALEGVKIQDGMHTSPVPAVEQLVRRLRQSSGSTREKLPPPKCLINARWDALRLCAGRAAALITPYLPVAVVA